MPEHTSGVYVLQPSPRVSAEPGSARVGERFGCDSLRFSGAQNIPGFKNAFNALSRASQKYEETPGISMHRVDLHGRRCRLFTNDTRIPKLDVAGSIPVSRSIVFNNLERNWPFLQFLHRALK
jgi:hypothetical protein